MNTREKGKKGEQTAVAYIEAKGGRVIDKNFFFKGGEIDLVVRDHWLNEEYLCFVEVKMRDTTEAGYPEEAITPLKQRRIIKGASFYMNYKNILPEHTAIRFDVVAILGDEVKWLKNAFSM